MDRVQRVDIAFLAGAALLAAMPAHAAPRADIKVEDKAVTAVTEPAEIAAWLQRLAGKYSIEGVVTIEYAYEVYPAHSCGSLDQPYCNAIHGKGDCVAIGTGPGVQCMFNAMWVDMYEVVYPSSEPGVISNEPSGVFNLPGGVSNLGPAMLLFGIDPLKSGINYLLVDNKGLPEGGMGFITGNRATFKTACVNSPSLFLAMKPPPQPPEPPNFRTAPRACERILRIDAKPDAIVVHWSIDIEINDDLWTRQEFTLRRVPPDQMN